MNLESFGKEEVLPVESAEMESDPRAAERQTIIERAKQKLNDVLNNHIVTMIAENGATLVPGLDVQKFWETAENTTGFTSFRYMAASGLSAEYWKLLVDSGANDAAYAVAGTVLLLRLPEIIATAAAQRPAVARFARAAGALLSEQSDKVQMVWQRFASFAKEQRAHGS